MNWYILFIAAAVPLVVGFVWYGPLFNKQWLASIGKTKEEMEANPPNMLVTFGCTYIFGLFFATILMQLSIHQMGAVGMMGGDAASTAPSFVAFMAEFGTAFRTFKHGALHGGMASFFLSLFLVAVPALYERKNWTYIMIHTGYNVVCGIIMGGLICQFV
jgi:hypothetical protein